MWKHGKGKENVEASMYDDGGSSSLDISHLHCDVKESYRESKIRRLVRADSDIPSNYRPRVPRPFMKEIKRQNSVGDIFSVILSKSRDQINSLFNRKFLTSSRRSQIHINHSRSPENLSKFQDTKASPVNHSDTSSSILTQGDTHSYKSEVPNIKLSLSPTLENIQTGGLKLQLKSMDKNSHYGPKKTLNRHQSIDIHVHRETYFPSRHLVLNTASELKSQLTRILDYLFIGGIEGAYNESVLCKANINALVDIANVPANFMFPGRKLNCPCLCLQKLHFRSKLHIAIDDIEWESMEQYFEDINSFIEGARKSHKSVLIYSYHGRSRAAAAVIQYLMSNFKVSLDLAYRTVKCKRPDITINRGLWKALERLDKTIVESDDAIEIIESVQTDYLTAPKIKTAWQDC